MIKYGVTAKSHNLNGKKKMWTMTNTLPDWSRPSIDCCGKTDIPWEIRESAIPVTSKPKDGLKPKENNNKVMLCRPIKQEVRHTKSSFASWEHLNQPPPAPSSQPSSLSGCSGHISSGPFSVSAPRFSCVEDLGRGVFFYFRGDSLCFHVLSLPPLSHSRSIR